MAAWFTSKHLDGFSNWMRAQAQEEYAHAMKLFDYLNERGGTGSRSKTCINVSSGLDA